MTPAQRVKAVYQGQTPDQVPLMLDISHWYKKNYNVLFDLSGFKQVEQGLVDLHKKIRAVSYVEMGSYYDLYFDDDSISEKAWTENGVFHHQIITPLGKLHEQRVFEQMSYSYNIKKHLLETVDDFEIVCFIMEHYKCRPAFERCHAWRQALGDLAFNYCSLPYSGLGYLISRNFGVEKTCLAMYDYPNKVKKLVNSVNNCNLRILGAIIDGPFDVVMQSDNFDSNVQNTDMFNEYSRDYYTEAARRLHENGKYYATHVDGEMRGCLKNMSECGVDCIDAATPAPMFSLTPAQARAEASPNLIPSGGIPATVFGATGTDEEFIESVKAWLDKKIHLPGLF